MNWLHYLMEANIYLGVFYLCYCLLLNAETHYTLSRVYLLFSCVLAFILPFTQLGILRPALPEMEQAVMIINPAVKDVQAFKIVPAAQVTPQLTLQDWLLYAYFLGALVAFGTFIYRLYLLFKLSRSKKGLYHNKYHLIQLHGDNTAFSFFNYLFIGTEISQSDTIINHELVHIRQKHSFDIVFLELLKVVNWFNPFVYLVQRSLKTLHEYIADEQTAAQERDALTYSSFLLNNAYGIQGSSIAHSFFNYNLLKKRIIMLNKNRSGKLARLKYLAVLPLCGGMLCASTLAFSKNYGWIDLSPKTLLPKKSATVKRLKIIKGEITMFSDNVSVKGKDGLRKMYHVSTITPADITYLLKEHKLKVEVVELDSATNINNPIVYLPDTKTDTSKHMLPPPPPPVMLKPEFHDLSNYLGNTVKYPKAAFDKKKMGSMVISFDVDASGKIKNVKSMGTPPGGFFEAINAPIENYPGSIKTKAGNYKMGINFMILGLTPVRFPKPSVEKNADYIGEIIVAGMTAEQRKMVNQPIQDGKIIKRPPPPPPVEPRRKGVPKLPPPPPQLPPDNKAMLAPPPPHDTAYSTLFRYMGKHVRYPRAALDNNVTGNVILSYRLDNAHKVTDIKVLNGIGNGCDEEVIRALKTFDNTISRAPGTYYFATTFAIDGYTKKYEPVGEISTRSNFGGIVVIMAYPPVSKVSPGTNGKVNINNSDKPSPQKPAALPKVARTMAMVSPTADGKIAKAQGLKSFIIPPAPVGTDKNAAIQAPPAAYDKAYVNLYNHLIQNIQYPAAAIKSYTAGNVILSYHVDANHRITDIKLMNSIGKGCDESAVAALKSYRGNINKAAGEYFIAAVFALKGFTKKFQPLGDLRFKPNFAGVVVVGANAI